MLTLHAEVFQWNSTSPYSHTQITKLAFEVGVLYDLKTLLKPLSSVRGNRFDVFRFTVAQKTKLVSQESDFVLAKVCDVYFSC